MQPSVREIFFLNSNLPNTLRMGMNENSKIYVAGHRGLVGSAIWRELQKQGFKNLVGKTRSELDLLSAAAVEQFYATEQPTRPR